MYLRHGNSKKLTLRQFLKKMILRTVKNYRPISLISTIGKSYGKIVHKHVFNFFSTNNVITSLQ